MGFGLQNEGDPEEKSQDTRGKTITPSAFFVLFCFVFSQEKPPRKAGGKQQK